MWKDAFFHNKSHSNYFVIEKDEYSFLVLNAFTSSKYSLLCGWRAPEIGNKIICSAQRPWNTCTQNILGKMKM